MDKIYIILPVHNRRHITQRFIDCLKAQTYQDYHLLLIDDGSTDGTQEMVRDEIADLSVITGPGDWWWAGALQQGYDWFCQQDLDDSNLVLIINDDTEFADDFLERAACLMEGQKKTLLLAQSFSRETRLLVGAGVQVDWSKLKFTSATTPDQIDCFSTRGLFLTVEDFLATGGFHPKVLPHYLSDYEFTLRAKRKGMRLWLDDDLKLWVDEETTGFHQFEDDSFTMFCKKYFAKNSDANPFAWTMFIWLACPYQWMLISWMRVWYGTFVKTLRALCR
jgi:GT2 family glycosyltransferase